jgi:hypothetical protein
VHDRRAGDAAPHNIRRRGTLWIPCPCIAGRANAHCDTDDAADRLSGRWRTHPFAVAPAAGLRQCEDGLDGACGLRLLARVLAGIGLGAQARAHRPGIDQIDPDSGVPHLGRIAENERLEGGLARSIGAPVGPPLLPLAAGDKDRAACVRGAQQRVERADQTVVCARRPWARRGRAATARRARPRCRSARRACRSARRSRRRGDRCPRPEAGRAAPASPSRRGRGRDRRPPRARPAHARPGSAWRPRRHNAPPARRRDRDWRR